MHLFGLADGIPPVQRALWSGFFVYSSAQFAERPAVIAEKRTLSYRELRDSALSLAATIQARPDPAATPLTAIFRLSQPYGLRRRSGSLLAGNGYVPLESNVPN